MNWVSAEPELFNNLFRHIEQSPLKGKVTAIVDGVRKDLTTPYIVIGETDIIESVGSQSMTEDIAVQMHVYADGKPLCRELKKDLKHYAKQYFPLENYEIKKIRLSNEQVMTDIDQYTSHGVLRLVYTVSHAVAF